MKVLFIFGGLSHYIIPILNRLNSIEDLEIITICASKKSATVGKGVYQSTSGAEFKILYLKEYTTYYNKFFFRGFVKAIKKEAPDIIVVGWSYILGFFLRPDIFFFLRKEKIKIIYRDIPLQLPKFHDTLNFYKNNGMFIEHKGYTKEAIRSWDLIKIKFLAYLRKIYFKLVDAHIYYTEDAIDIVKTYGVPEEKIFVSYNSPDTDYLFSIYDQILNEDHILPQNSFRLLHIGRLVKWKRVDLLIDAFKIIKDKYKNAELVIIGNGPEKEILEEKASSLNLKESVTFTGAIYDSKIVGKYLLSSQIYILAGMGGLSINEAMCFGKPVICSICDGTEKHLVFDDYNGKFFIEGNAADLSRKIDYMLSNRELIKTMGENSLKIIKENININTVINGYLKAFHYVCYKNKELY